MIAQIGPPLLIREAPRNAPLILALAIVLSLAACEPSRVTPDAYGVTQCDQDTACFWHAYQGCAMGTAARVYVLFAQSADGNGKVVRRSRTLSSGTPGAPCTVDVFEQVTIDRSNGGVGGAPGAIYQCAQITRDPTGALHLTDCQERGSSHPNVDVAAHG